MGDRLLRGGRGGVVEEDGSVVDGLEERDEAVRAVDERSLAVQLGEGKRDVSADEKEDEARRER